MLTLRGSAREIAAWYAIALLLAIPVKGTEEESNPISLFVLVILATGLLLLFYRLFGTQVLRKFLFAFELLFLGISAAYILKTFSLPVYPAVLAPVLRLVLKEKALNASTAFISGVVAGMVGKSMTPADVALFLLLMAVYDYVAVFGTGHMKSLARAVVPGLKDSPEGIYTGVHSLGSGDAVIPAILVSAMTKVSPEYGIAMTVSALFGLYFLILYSRKHPKMLPALPFIALPQLLAYVLLLQLA